MSEIFVGLGSNLGDRNQNLAYAAARLNAKVLKSSGIYETEPVGYKNQPWFLNQVIQVETDLEPLAFLAQCQEVEASLGRVRNISKGPRTIDIDLLFYNDEVIHHPDLKLPHPEIPFRRFVLVPFEEIAPNFKHPILQQTAGQLLQICPDHSEVRRFADNLASRL